MRRFSAFIVMLLLLSTAAPLMACVTGDAMSQNESACCRAMHNNCVDMEKMRCCQKQLSTDTAPQLVPSTRFEPFKFNAQWTVITYAAQASYLDRPMLRARLGMPAEYFPPGLRIAQTTVLRI